MRVILWVLILCASTLAQAESPLVQQLNHPVPGGVAVIPLGQGDLPKVFYQSKPVLVIRDEQQHALAVVGIPLSAKPGPQQIDLERHGQKITLNFSVTDRVYRAQYIILNNPQQVNPDPEHLKRINHELEEQSRAYRHFATRQPDSLLFAKPVNGPLSSPFGLKRFFNGEERNPHSGLDFAAPAGAPVKAPASGVVTLIGQYFFNGNTVFVDHGQGLVSMFCHLSQINVKPGDEVKRGSLLGKVGSTGRATGPHLHWNVSLNDVRIDPSIFIGAFKP